jgi:transcriptional regulator with XRE-family HTH domain
MMKNKTKARKYTSPLVAQLLGDMNPVERQQAMTKMMVAAKLDEIITQKGWGKRAFAEKLHKNPSEITKWLSGTHNFTLDTLAEISAVLNLSVSTFFEPISEQPMNRLEIVVPVKNIEQSILYHTPFSESASQY